MSNEVRFDENLACERCGRFGAYQFDGERVCAECYELRGSCCPEFGRDDFWREKECKVSAPLPPTSKNEQAG
jgi:hypothetical protein